MPEPVKSMVYFAFSIATRPGSQVGGLGDLISQMNVAGITVHNFSGYVSGHRTKFFCAPVDAHKFREFATKHKLRIREKTAVKLVRKIQPVMNLLVRFAISGDILPAFSVSSQAGFVYLPVKRH